MSKRKKTFRQRRPDPEHPGEWLWNVEGVRCCLPAAGDHRGDRLRPSGFHCRGRRQGRSALVLEFTATSNPGGAEKWKPEQRISSRCRCHSVPDNDEAGWKHVKRSVLRLPELLSASAFWCCPVFAEGRYHRLGKRAARASNSMRCWIKRRIGKPPSADKTKPNEDEKAKAKAREDELLAALAKAEGLDYVRQRKAAAKELACRPRRLTTRSRRAARTPRSHRFMATGSSSRGRSRSTATRCCATSLNASSAMSSSATMALSLSRCGDAELGA